MFAALREKLKGYKTMLATVAVGGLGVMNVAGGVDLKPVITSFVSDEHQVALILVLAAILFGSLRLITTAPVGDKHGDDPVKNVSDGN
jgi:hypothetical protein